MKALDIVVLSSFFCSPLSQEQFTHRFSPFFCVSLFYRSVGFVVVVVVVVFVLNTCPLPIETCV